MQDASTLATAHYPETLDRIFVRPINHCVCLEYLIADKQIGHWCTVVFPNSMGLDQAMV